MPRCRSARIAVLALLCAAGGAALFVRVTPGPRPTNRDMKTSNYSVERLDLSGFPDAPPSRALDLLFIHHSCGGQLLAPPGVDEGTNCIYATHPEGGGLRAQLEKNGYAVHEASYGSRVGDRTDLFDWLPKFRDQMQEILSCDMQDSSLPSGRRNEVVIFKSCFPNNLFRGQGTPPGDAAGDELTVWNARAAYAGLLEEFKARPEVLFVSMTAPPLAPGPRSQPVWRVLLNRMRGRVASDASAAWARQFNNWLSAKDGWLRDYPLENVVVFDLYDVLTNYGESNLAAYPTRGGYDSHPNREGNARVTEAFVPFLNQAVNRWMAQRTRRAA